MLGYLDSVNLINSVMQKSNLACDGNKPYRKNFKCEKRESQIQSF